MFDTIDEQAYQLAHNQCKKGSAHESISFLLASSYKPETSQSPHNLFTLCILMPDRFLNGLIILTIIIVIGTLVYRSQPSDKQEEVPGQVETIKEEVTPSTQVKAKIQACRREQGSKKTLATGYIENIGNADLRYVTLEIQWQTRLGTVIEANEIYVLRDESLAPGKRKEFVSATDNRIAERCNVRKVDWW